MARPSRRVRLTDGPATFALKVGATGATLLTNLLLARMLGAEAFGPYAYAITWASLAAVPAVLGLDMLLLREIASGVARADWAMVNGLLRFSYAVVAALGIALAVIVGLFAGVLTSGAPDGVAVFWIGLSTVPLIALIRLSQSAMRGLLMVISGQLPELLVKPALTIGLVVIAALSLGAAFTGIWAMAATAVATGVAAVIALRQVSRALPFNVQSAKPQYFVRRWLGSSGPLLLIGGIQIVNRQIDIILVGAILGVKEAGIYTIAARGAELVSFVLFAVNAGLAPRIAHLHATGARTELEAAVVRGARSATIASLPLVAGFFFFGGQFLGLFGPEFVVAATALAILSIARAVAAFMGSVGVALTMTGNERVTAAGMGSAAIVNVVLNVILIPVWGLTGAAISSATGLVLWNVILAVMVRRRLGIASTGWGSLTVRARP